MRDGDTHLAVGQSVSFPRQPGHQLASRQRANELGVQRAAAARRHHESSLHSARRMIGQFKNYVGQSGTGGHDQPFLRSPMG